MIEPYRMFPLFFLDVLWLLCGINFYVLCASNRISRVTMTWYENRKRAISLRYVLYDEKCVHNLC